MAKRCHTQRLTVVVEALLPGRSLSAGTGSTRRSESDEHIESTQSRDGTAHCSAWNSGDECLDELLHNTILLCNVGGNWDKGEENRSNGCGQEAFGINTVYVSMQWSSLGPKQTYTPSLSDILQVYEEDLKGLLFTRRQKEGLSACWSKLLYEYWLKLNLPSP